MYSSERFSAIESNPTISHVQFLCSPQCILPACRCGFFCRKEQREVIYSEGVTGSAGVRSDPLEKMFCCNESVVSDSPTPIEQSCQNLNHRVSCDILISFFPNVFYTCLFKGGLAGLCWKPCSSAGRSGSSVCRFVWQWWWRDPTEVGFVSWVGDF